MMQRIAIVGAESTGKSWLARELHTVLRERGARVHWVEEHLRVWCEREQRMPQAHEQHTIARTQAENVLAIASGIVIADTTPLMTAIYSHHFFADESLYAMALEHQRLYHMTLVTGLDLPWQAQWLRDSPHSQGRIDALLRQSLMRAGMGFQVVYGQGLVRLNNALLALGLPPEDEQAWQRRQDAQHALNAGRTAWLCEKCSDPECEHRLFTGLLQRPQPRD
jgi:HTH-type transcriptional regulator, transcriptional repressor of NAD biosynthesis genes